MQKIILESSASNAIQVVYTLEPALYGNLISQWRSGVGVYHLFDGLGSTTQLTNIGGTVTDSYVYDSWGNIVVASGATVNWFRYIGSQEYYYDHDTNNYILRFRRYDPSGGRFLSIDPIMFVSNDYNLYRYVHNNTINITDASGLIGGNLNPFTWEYGRYCGLYNTGQRRPTDPPDKKVKPWDSLDTACEAHDRCLSTLSACLNPFNILKCSSDLCNAALIAGFWGGCAKDYPRNPFKKEDCQAAAAKIASLFCVVVPPNPFSGFPGNYFTL
jgi:RHS repeat-associated protein